MPIKDLELEKIIKLNEDKEAYINFIEALKSDATKRLYRNTLFLFLRYCNITDCDQFIKLPIPDIEIFIQILNPFTENRQVHNKKDDATLLI